MNFEKCLRVELERVCKLIISKYNPLKIIAFGSIANKQVAKYSDIDLAIIKETDEKFINRSITLVKLTNPEEPIDFLVYTPEEIQMAKQQKNLFVINEILKKGKVLFDNGVLYEF